MDPISEHNPLYRGDGKWLVRKFTSHRDHLGTRLEHSVRHSPDGFSWGYGGSGPTELARCLLIDALGVAHPHPRLYQDFKSAFVARWADEWRIDAATIRMWVVGWRHGTGELDRHSSNVENTMHALGLTEPSV